MKLAGLIAAFLLLSLAANAQVIRQSQGRKIMIFGGADHDVYLGCLSCTEFASDAVVNTFSPYGSSFSLTSIFNSFSPYGSSFAVTGACNSFGSTPPIIVDSRGSYYGELTMNEARAKRTKSKIVLAWLTGVCAGH